MWYGSYKIVLNTTQVVLLRPSQEKKKDPCGSKLLAVITGGTILYASKIFMPFSEHVPNTALLKINHIKEFPAYIKNTAQYLKGFPYKYCIVCIAASGFISGFVVALFES